MVVYMPIAPGIQKLIDQDKGQVGIISISNPSV